MTLFYTIRYTAPSKVNANVHYMSEKTIEANSEEEAIAIFRDNGFEGNITAITASIHDPDDDEDPAMY